MSANSKPSSARTLEQAWRCGAGPGGGPLVIDVDSTICEVAGKHKQGAGFGYTKVLGYHPILATRADTGEVLHARMRKGQANTQRGARRFIDELIARVRRAGATGRAHRPGRFGILVQRHHRHAEPARRALHDGGALRRHRRGRGDRRDPRGGMGRHRLHPRRSSSGRRHHLHHRQRAATDHSPAGRAPHPPHRHRPTTVVARLAPPRLPHRHRR